VASAGRKLRHAGHRAIQLYSVTGNIEQDPVDVGGARRIGIFTDQRITASSHWSAAPLQVGRHVIAFAAVDGGDGRTLFEGR
jgi:hypothetical protein